MIRWMKFSDAVSVIKRYNQWYATNFILVNCFFHFSSISTLIIKKWFNSLTLFLSNVIIVKPLRAIM